MSGEDYHVVHGSAFVIDPCQVYDKDLKNFTLACTDGCVVSEFGPAVCCSDIECRANDAGPVCGNDGRSYESECALERLDLLFIDEVLCTN